MKDRRKKGWTDRKEGRKKKEREERKKGRKG